MDLSKIETIYMIGIKGVGMTMLAQFLAENGAKVAGSDIDEKFMTDKVLKKIGVKVFEKFDEKNIPQAVDLIIYSSAYNAENNIEVAKALSGKKKVLTYAKALAEIFNKKYGIAVVGSHGKTTTTAWLGYVMNKAGLEPSVMAGAQVDQFGGCGIAGKSDYMVIEADEYQNKLQYLNPKAVLLNNIDYDHPDFFASKEEYEKVFVEFIKKIPAKGFLIANFDDPTIRKIVAKCNCKVISYAIDLTPQPPLLNKRGGDNLPSYLGGAGGGKTDYSAYDIKQNNGKQYFKVKFGVDDSFSGDENIVKGEDFFPEGDFNIQLSGKHNISNALAVIAACLELGVKLSDIKKYLAEFTGTARRMQIMGKFNNAIIIDDYAHHPTEIKATLAGAREVYPKNKLITVFHPHTFSRTKALLDDFAGSFGLADEIIVLDIYGSAREEQGGVHSKDLVNRVKSMPSRSIGGQKSKVKSQHVLYIPTLDECEEYLRNRVKSGDVVLLMGAGDVFRIGEGLVKNL